MSEWGGSTWTLASISNPLDSRLRFWNLPHEDVFSAQSSMSGSHSFGSLYLPVHPSTSAPPSLSHRRHHHHLATTTTPGRGRVAPRLKNQPTNKSSQSPRPSPRIVSRPPCCWRPSRQDCSECRRRSGRSRPSGRYGRCFWGLRGRGGGGYT